MQAGGLVTLTWRAIVGSDVAAWAELLAAAEAVDSNDRNHGVRALAESVGMHPVRWWYEMEGQVGTRPPWRGRGVASTLLTHVLAACRVHGYQRAALSVDTGNPTGALGIYERTGFIVTERATSYVRPLRDV